MPEDDFQPDSPGESLKIQADQPDSRLESLGKNSEVNQEEIHSDHVGLVDKYTLNGPSSSSRGQETIVKEEPTPDKRDSDSPGQSLNGPELRGNDINPESNSGPAVHDNSQYTARVRLSSEIVKKTDSYGRMTGSSEVDIEKHGGIQPNTQGNSHIPDEQGSSAAAPLNDIQVEPNPNIGNIPEQKFPGPLNRSPSAHLNHAMPAPIQSKLFMIFCYITSLFLSFWYLLVVLICALIEALFATWKHHGPKGKLDKKERKLVKDLGFYVGLSGYKLEEITVTTKDGFNLVLHHLTNPGRDTEKKHYPVLMMHGLMQSSAAYCTSGPNSLAFYLLNR